MIVPADDHDIVVRLLSSLIAKRLPRPKFSRFEFSGSCLPEIRRDIHGALHAAVLIDRPLDRLVILFRQNPDLLYVADRLQALRRHPVPIGILLL